MEGGPEHLDSRPVTPLARSRVVVVLAVLVVVVVALVVLDQRRLERPQPVPTPTPAASRVRVAPNPVPSRSPSPGSVTPVTTRGSGPLAAGVPAGVLYARATDVVYRIDTRTGTVVRTPGADLASSGPVSLATTARGLLVRPWDSVPGFRLDDGQTPVPLAGSLAQVHEVLPGPDGRVWAVETTYPDVTARLVDDRGRARGPRVTSTGSLLADGTGGLLLQDVGGVWQASPGPVRRLTTGLVLAVGPTAYLLHECDDRHRCVQVVLDRASGRRTPLGSALPADVIGGTTSPAGALAALARGGESSSGRLAVVRLPEGRTVRTFDTTSNPYGVAGPALWLSARWLVVATGATVVLYDAENDRVVRPNLPVTGVDQLAWWPAAR